jgi:F0F1-type ATP synthase membrane subunit b/b'
MKFLLFFLVVVFCGCCETQKASVSLHERQEAVANEIVSIESDYTKALVSLNNANATNFVIKANSLADRLEAISKELDTLGLFSMELRKATLAKMDKLENDDKDFAKLRQNGMKLDLQPKVAETVTPIMERYLSASVDVNDKVGLLLDAKGNPIDDQTVRKFRFNNSTN